MSRRKWSIVLAVALLGVVPVARASAHTLDRDDRPRCFVRVPFAFEVGERSLSPGLYAVEAPTPGVIVLRDTHSNATFTLPVRGRLMPSASGAAREVRIVFDKVRGEERLLQVWLPNRDGFLLAPAHDNQSQLASNLNGSD